MSRRNDAQRRQYHNGAKHIKENVCQLHGIHKAIRPLTVGFIGILRFLYFFLVCIAYFQQNFLRKQQIVFPVGTIFEHRYLDNGIDRARFLAQAAEYAFALVDICLLYTSRCV